MAPPFARTTQDRRAAASRLLEVLASVDLPQADPNALAAFSSTKGLFTRIYKEDQWDWFTVMSQLGYPSARISKAISLALADCRSAIRDRDERAYWSSRSDLMRLPLRRCLGVFLGSVVLAREPGAGWIYVLSTREIPDLLKIGMTTRTVQERSKEINNSTGVAIPFGVRRCWMVSDPARAERQVHACLGGHRIRGDREFFRIDFMDASRMIVEALRQERLMLRTLDNLGALAESAPEVDCRAQYGPKA